MKKSIILLVFLLSGLGVAKAQKEATFKEYNKTYVTYPFSDPDPIPAGKKIYPYFRFDGFALEGQEKEWKVVLLENDYISVQVMPEIGGKIWTATDKTTGKDFFYNNGVVKFRDIAMRGPWVSGGIEINYGIIGHAPSTSAPVDYLVRKNDDGSVSCFTSTLDLLTRTRWVVEIKLEKDKAYFTTRSFWSNSTGMEQPYYTWMNAGIPEGKKLRFLYPGSHSISHGGGASEWPLDKEGRDLSYYDQNNFGSSKSYHVAGKHSHYFGALWGEDDFGMIHYSNREEKLGKKIFLWALSGSGKIWEDLLTDNSGQYVEIQSGRLFNQNQFQSSSTPFKQIGFAPYSTDSWTEYWYPFHGLGGFTSANLAGAFNVDRQGQQLTVNISPVQSLKDSLYVFDDKNEVVATQWVEARPLEQVSIPIAVPEGTQISKISIKEEVLDFGEEEALSRPMQLAEGFDSDAAYGLYLQGRDLAQFRQFDEAEVKINSSLGKDPLFIPALVEMSKLKLFRMQYDSAFYYSQKALSIDTYDGAANYYYGKAANLLSRRYDALDGFEVASLTSDYRNAAYTALAGIYLQQNERSNAKSYAEKSLLNNGENIHSLRLLYLIAREEKEVQSMEAIKSKIVALNPLDHFIGFETYLQAPSKESKDTFLSKIQNEMPGETLLELAVMYSNWGREEESKKILELAPTNTETLFWLAWLTRNEGQDTSNSYLERASQSVPDFVFPFREESAKVLHWAADKAPSWQSNYLLALIDDFRGNGQEALKRMKIDEGVDFAPFYILRARLTEDKNLASQLADVDKAITIEPKQWRYAVVKSRVLAQLNRGKEAIEVLKQAYHSDKSNYIVGLELVRLLTKESEYAGANGILETLHVLPFEGATDARRYFRETKLMLAQEALEKKRYKEALSFINEAVEWPSRLGVGKPFPENINEDLENWMRYTVNLQSGKKAEARKFLEKVKDKDISSENYLKKIQGISSKADRRIF